MEIARLWREQPSHLRLEGSCCPSCEARLFPVQCRCPECGQTELAPFQYCGRGSVLAWTTVYEAPRGFQAQVPYVAALVKLDEGPVVPSMLTDIDPGQCASGLRVEMVTRKISSGGEDDPIVYGYKFAPLEDDDINNK